MAAIQMTYSLAMAASRDAGNRSMRKAGRKAWNEDDYNASVDTFNKCVGLDGSQDALLIAVRKMAA